MIRQLTITDKDAMNKLATHPLQMYEWGEFREKTGVKVVRVGEFENEKLVSAYQITVHTIPHTSFTIGYFPKGPKPTNTMLETLTQIGKEYNCIFIKLEPNVEVSEFSEKDLNKFKANLKVPYKGLFTKYSFVLDLTPTEEELLANMKSKTRYNVRLAEKRGVKVSEEISEEAFGEYLKLQIETTARQKFFAHDENYHKLMWQTLGPAGIAHLMLAKYEGKILTAWILFLCNGVLYYPYGGSSEEHRDVMASNLMMWEAIKWGKRHGATKFDMWGALPLDADPKDSRMGFHRFKEGYNPRHVEFAGTYDLILNPIFYRLYTLADKMRWMYLKLKK